MPVPATCTRCVGAGNARRNCSGIRAGSSPMRSRWAVTPSSAWPSAIPRVRNSGAERVSTGREAGREVAGSATTLSPVSRGVVPEIVQHRTARLGLAVASDMRSSFGGRCPDMRTAVCRISLSVSALGRHVFPLAFLSVAGGHRTCYDRPRRPRPFGSQLAMSAEHTTAAVQRYLNALAGDQPAEPIVRALLDRSVRRLHLLCANLLYRQYRRLTLPPLNLQPDEMLGAVVERLLKAMHSVRPQTVRQFFALVNQHMRWELNDLARRLDEQPTAVELHEGMVPAPASSDSVLTPDGRRMLEAIDKLPEDEREVFGLVRIQGLTQSEAADVLGVSAKTVQRRLNRSLLLLAKELDDLRPT